MPLRSPWFSKDPTLEKCFEGKHRMLASEEGLAVMRVQAALIELGYALGSAGADGIFGNGTGQAVTAYKTDKGLSPNDPVVGPGTMKALDDDLFFEPPEEDPRFGQFSLWVGSRQLDSLVGQELNRMMGAPSSSWRRMVADFAFASLDSDRLLGFVARSRRQDLKGPLVGAAAAVQGGVPVEKWFDDLDESNTSGATMTFSAPDGSLGTFVTVTDKTILGRETIDLTATGQHAKETLAGVIGHELTHVRNIENEDVLGEIPDSDASTYVDTALAAARSAVGPPTGQVLEKFVAEMCARHVHWAVVRDTSAPGTVASLTADSLAAAVHLYFSRASDRFDLNKYIAGVNAQGRVAQLSQLDLWLRRGQAFSFSDDAAENARTQALFRASADVYKGLAANPAGQLSTSLDGLFPLPQDFH